MNLGPEFTVVMADIPRSGRRRGPLPRLTVLGVVVPLAAKRRAIGVHEQPGTHSHFAVIRLQQPTLSVLLEMGGDAATGIEEVLRRDHG